MNKRKQDRTDNGTKRLQEIRARLDGLSWVGDEFIAHAPADIKWLLDEVDAARREILGEIARLTATKTHAIIAGQFELAAEINDSIRALPRSIFGRTPHV